MSGGRQAASGFQDWLSSHIFTPTELEAYQLCPFRFYAQAFLGLKPVMTREVELTPPELGRLVHRVLERYLKAGAQGEPSSLLAEELTAVRSQHPRLSLPLLELQQRRIERMLASFADDHRSALQASSSLKPRYFEWEFGKKTPPLTLNLPGGKKVRFAGRIDRIDVDDAHRRFLVIDYKTGSTKTPGSQILSGQTLQLPLYILAVRQILLPGFEPIGGLYYQLSDMSKKDGLLHAERLPEGLEIHPRSSSLIPSGKWEAVFEKILGKISKILEEIERLEFPSHAEPCEPYCPYQDICKIRSAETPEPPL